MAKIYNKNGTDKTLIPIPGEGILRRFNFGDDWSQIRLGVFASVVTAAGDNTNGVAESLAVSTPTDLISFGIKDPSPTIPGSVGCSFVGMITVPGNPSAIQVIGSNAQIGFGANGLRIAGYKDTTLITTAGSNASIPCQNAADASAYAGFYGVKFELANRGLASQTITITTASDATPTIYTSDNLRTLLNNGTYGGSSTVAWNNGSVAYDIPNCFWFRLPFFNNRVRLSAIRAIRYI